MVACPYHPGRPPRILTRTRRPPPRHSRDHAPVNACSREFAGVPGVCPCRSAGEDLEPAIDASSRGALHFIHIIDNRGQNKRYCEYQNQYFTKAPCRPKTLLAYHSEMVHTGGGMRDDRTSPDTLSFCVRTRCHSEKSMPPLRHAYRYEPPQRRHAIMPTKVGAAPYISGSS
jgi:hypothetical protein